MRNAILHVINFNHDTGHSNGGQGVWHLAVHFPDKIIAGLYALQAHMALCNVLNHTRTVVPAAGYIKIQDYVSFANWVGSSYSDPWLRGVCVVYERNSLD